MTFITLVGFLFYYSKVNKNINLDFKKLSVMTLIFTGFFDLMFYAMILSNLIKL